MIKHTDTKAPTMIWHPPGHDIIKPFNPHAAKDAAAHAMMDLNADGKLSKDEWTRTGRSAEMFEAYDKNGDGKVCEKEYVNGRKAEREFASKDRNGDGTLSFHEWAGRMLHKGGSMMKGVAAFCIDPFKMDLMRFKRQDANGDGKISSAEYVKANTPAEPVFPTRPWLMKATV